MGILLYANLRILSESNQEVMVHVLPGFKFHVAQMNPRHPATPPEKVNRTLKINTVHHRRYDFMSRGISIGIPY